jgi:hypothetical protein
MDDLHRRRRSDRARDHRQEPVRTAAASEARGVGVRGRDARRRARAGVLKSRVSPRRGPPRRRDAAPPDRPRPENRAQDARRWLPRRRAMPDLRTTSSAASAATRPRPRLCSPTTRGPRRRAAVEASRAPILPAIHAGRRHAFGPVCVAPPSSRAQPTARRSRRSAAATPADGVERLVDEQQATQRSRAR